MAVELFSAGRVEVLCRVIDSIREGQQQCFVSLSLRSGWLGSGGEWWRVTVVDVDVE